MLTARPARGYAMYTRSGWIFIDSVRRTRREVVAYADNDAAPGWNWDRYRQAGFFIAKVSIIPLDGPVRLALTAGSKP